MSEQLVRPLETITAEIQFYKGQAGLSLLEIGKRLNEAKEQLDHGQWLDWLEHEADISVSMAQKMMKVAREYANTESIPYLGVTKALALLSVPAEEREQFAEAVNAEALSVRELKQAIRERDAAKQERQAAEASRLEMEQSLHAARTELEALKNRPPETVTVDASEAQIAAAEQRGRERAQAETAQVRQASEQARQEMQNQISQLEQEAAQRQEELEELRQAAQANGAGAKTAQALGEINGRLRAMQEADRRINELMDTLDEMTRRRVQGVREMLLRRMLGEVNQS